MIDLTDMTNDKPKVSLPEFMYTSKQNLLFLVLFVALVVVNAAA